MGVDVGRRRLARGAADFSPSGNHAISSSEQRARLQSSHQVSQAAACQAVPRSAPSGPGPGPVYHWLRRDDAGESPPLPSKPPLPFERPAVFVRGRMFARFPAPPAPSPARLARSFTGFCRRCIPSCEFLLLDLCCLTQFRSACSQALLCRKRFSPTDPIQCDVVECIPERTRDTLLHQGALSYYHALKSKYK